MKNKKSTFITAAFLVIVLLSFKAKSDSSYELDTRSGIDKNAFSNEWSGEYYAEPELEVRKEFSSFEEKQKYYLESPIIGLDKDYLSEEELGEEKRDVEESFEEPLPTPSGSPAKLNPKQQSFKYYNLGFLRNPNELELDGLGFLKVLRKRDQNIGGRQWGSFALVDFIRNLARDFQIHYPGRERLQIADLSRKMGGPNTHVSHENGLEADIIFLRVNRAEQDPLKNTGKNGFAEQFVLPGPMVTVSIPVRIKTIDPKTKKVKFLPTGKMKKITKPSQVVSKNFDTEANFELLLLAEKLGKVHTYFMDKLLVREMQNYAKSKKRDHEELVRSMLSKLNEEKSHADHVHIRLMCQELDATLGNKDRCRSATVAEIKKRSAVKKPAPKHSPVKKS